MAEELKACPFCGGSPSHKAWSNPSGEYGPGCTECGVTADTCAVWNTRAQLPSQGGEAVEVVASIAVDAEGVVRDFTLEPGLDRHPGGYTVTPLMTVAQHQRILAAGVQKAGEAVATDAFVPGSLADLLFQLGEKGIGVSGGTHGDHWMVSPLYTHPADQVADDLTMVKVLRELLEQIAVELEHDNDRYFLGRELRALLNGGRS